MYRDDTPVPLSKSCQMVGGSNAIPQNFKARTQGLKPQDRIRKNQRPMMRAAKRTPGTTGGFYAEAYPQVIRPMTKAQLKTYRKYGVVPAYLR